MKGFKELVQKGNGNIGNLTPTTRNLNLQDLNRKTRELIAFSFYRDETFFSSLSLTLPLYKVMTEALRPLGEEKSRSKRETMAEEQQKEQLNDETQTPVDDEVLESTKNEIKSATNTIQLPLGKKGNPAFSIHASTVYILYPSLFQDPNIFGRFSIPQSINMDRSVTSEDEKMKAEIHQMPSVKRQQQQQQTKVVPGRKGKRSAPPSPQNQQAEEKKNIETHLTGTIVVQNQDVNENNRRDSY